MKKVPEWNYKFLRPLAIVLLKIIYQPKVINKQAIPKEGPIILAGNHKAYPDPDRKSTRLNSSHIEESRMPSSA